MEPGIAPSSGSELGSDPTPLVGRVVCTPGEGQGIIARPPGDTPGGTEKPGPPPQGLWARLTRHFRLTAGQGRRLQPPGGETATVRRSPRPLRGPDTTATVLTSRPPPEVCVPCSQAIATPPSPGQLLCQQESLRPLPPHTLGHNQNSPGTPPPPRPTPWPPPRPPASCLSLSGSEHLLRATESWTPGAATARRYPSHAPSAVCGAALPASRSSGPRHSPSEAPGDAPGSQWPFPHGTR